MKKHIFNDDIFEWDDKVMNTTVSLMFKKRDAL
jgi:hypothetical protein